ncbi:MAG: hypothetical protein BGO01_05425 [Armatimonadetes bacterium 55-13]|nr:hypothetical protein [Armatimonadota bacterium]OJU61518.1 MAG: hypothetical protein BGO01_05425 [Armatimonadetes bacterium 55-13]
MKLKSLVALFAVVGILAAGCGSGSSDVTDDAAKSPNPSGGPMDKGMSNADVKAPESMPTSRE